MKSDSSENVARFIYLTIIGLPGEKVLVCSNLYGNQNWIERVGSKELLLFLPGMWFRPLTPALLKLRQEDNEFSQGLLRLHSECEASLSYLADSVLRENKVNSEG